ncbi:unnamed protein product [Arctia plantaginis]|uniref:Protein dead ringer n=1 Tax=Arctia plantaginis TaxID=874455 RepID=A0A8S0ZN28_ARCPL|nr:unnamed protein product [Arctia plantaginis]
MAKSVLDLYELYNLVVARGGLVEVINKKLWQEIIKGLKLPSSITSAAFTLRTQYMKYLYEYECDKNHFSVRPELEAAIEGNKREGRRASGQFDAQAALAMHPPMNRGIPASLAQLSHHMQPLPLPLGAVAPRMPMPPHPPHIPPHEIEYRVREYLKMLQQQREQLLQNGAESPPTVSVNGQAPAMSPREAALNAMDISTRFTLWSIYGNQNGVHASPPDLEPQREALNLSESPGSSTSGGKREGSQSSPPPAKRRPASASPSATPPSSALAPPAHISQLNTPSTSHAFNGPSTSQAFNGPSTSHSFNGPSTSHAINGPSTSQAFNGPTTNGTNGAAFKITTRGDASTGDQQLVVTIELNGVTYEGILFPANNSENEHRQMVS